MKFPLRFYRRKTELKISDMASVYGLSSTSYLSKCERNLKKASLEIILIYSIILSVPAKELIKEHRQLILQKITTELPKLISKLENRKSNPRLRARIKHLQTIYQKINQEEI